jgi:hypothetical protein
MLTQSLINSFIVFDLFTVPPTAQEQSPNNEEEQLTAEMEASISIHLDAQPCPSLMRMILRCSTGGFFPDSSITG